MKSIFISYRRAETEDSAGRLHEALRHRLPDVELFIDIDNLRAGDDFVAELEKSLSATEVMLVVIGRSWLNAVDGEGKRRLDNPEDFVRREIAEALARNIKVVPVLVQGATMPVESDLPDPLKPLARRHCVELRASRYSDDVAHLVSQLEDGRHPARRSPPSTKTQRRRTIAYASALAVAVAVALWIWWPWPVPNECGAYYDLPLNRHETTAERCTGAGYRLGSLSIYGAERNRRVAAVWVPSRGTRSVRFGDKTVSEFWMIVEKYQAQGLRPTVLSLIVDSGGQPKLYGVLDESKGSARASFDSDFESFTQRSRANKQLGLSPEWFSMKESAGRYMVAAVWSDARKPTDWLLTPLLDSSSYDRRFDELKPEGFKLVFPAIACADGDFKFAALYERHENDTLPYSYAFHDLNMDGVLKLLREKEATGLTIRQVQGCQVGSSARFVGLLTR